MSEQEQQISRIGQKIHQLVKLQTSLERTNKDLLVQVESLKKQCATYIEAMDVLQQQIEVLKAVKSDLSEEEKKGLERRLSQYIKEIDRCIAMLNE